MSRSETRAQRPWRLFAGLVLAVAAVGAVGFAVGEGTRAALSFLAGLLIATAVATLAAILVDVAGTIRPNLAMVMAMTNYVMTIVIFVLLLRTVDSSTVDVPAFATGLATSVVPYLAWQFRLARPRP